MSSKNSSQNSFGAKDELQVGDNSYEIYREPFISPIWTDLTYKDPTYLLPLALEDRHYGGFVFRSGWTPDDAVVVVEAARRFVVHHVDVIVVVVGDVERRVVDDAGHDREQRLRRCLEPFDGPFEKVTDWNVRPPAGQVAAMPNAAAYALSRDANDSFRAVNRLQKQGQEGATAGA